jgi:hypothetical protein
MPRRPKLVTQFLERIHRNAFADHPEIIRSLVQRRNGIYALYAKDELYYVGLAQDLRWRLKLESLAIRITRAAGNKQLGKFSGAENLERSLDGQLRAKHKRERDTLFGRPMEEAADASPRRTRSIRGRYKSQTIRARWRPDGTVRLKGKVYSSLSAAATKATGHPTNGRWFWRVERSPGDWVRVKNVQERR